MNRNIIVLACGALAFVALTGGALAIREARHRMPKPLPKGQCTWYAARRTQAAGWKLEFSQFFGRDARRWPDVVKNGKLVDKPAVGSLMILDAWDGNPYGHVGYVESVKDAAHFTITHANMGTGMNDSVEDGVVIRRVEVVRSGNSVTFGKGKFGFKLLGFIVRSSEN